MLCTWGATSCSEERELFDAQMNDSGRQPELDMSPSTDTRPPADVVDLDQDDADSPLPPRPMLRGPIIDDGTDVTLWRQVGEHAADTSLTTEVDALFQGEVLIFNATEPDEQWRRPMYTTYPVISFKCRSPGAKFELAFTIQTEASGPRTVRYLTEPLTQQTSNDLVRLLPPEILDDEVHEVRLNLAADIESEGARFAFIEDLRVKAQNLRLDDIRFAPAPQKEHLGR